MGVQVDVEGAEDVLRAAVRVRRGREPQAADRLPVDGVAELLLQPSVQFDAVLHHAREVALGSELTDQPGGMPAPDQNNSLYADRVAKPSSEKLLPPPEQPMTADRVRWEHIQRVYELCNRNVSETARRLNMHRRTLQRILAKRAPK